MQILKKFYDALFCYFDDFDQNKSLIEKIDMVILRQFLDKDTLEILEKILENDLALSKNPGLS